MILEDILLVMLTTFLGWVASVLILFHQKKSPLRTPILIFGLSIASFTLGLTSILISLIFQCQAEAYNEFILESMFFHKFGFVLEMVGGYLIYLTFSLPRIRDVDTRTLLEQIMVVSVFGGTAAYNASRISLINVNGKIVVKYDLLGLFFLVMAVGLMLVALCKRANDIRRVVSMKYGENAFIYRFLPIFILTSLILGSIIFNYFFHHSQQQVPSFLWTLGVGFFFAYAALVLKKDESLLFAVPVIAESLHIIDSVSCATLYSRCFSLDMAQNELMLGNILGGLKISLEVLLSSKIGLRTISYENRVIIIHSGSLVTTFFVVSDVNPLIHEIVSNLTSIFEQEFRHQILQARKSKIVAAMNFVSFDHIIDEIKRKFFL